MGGCRRQNHLTFLKTLWQTTTLGLLIAGGISLSSCSLHVSRKKVPRNPTPPSSKSASASEVQAWRTRLGKVVLVDGAHDFVLVDIGTSPAPEPGSKLRSYSESTISGELNVSSQQRRPYLIADILAGGPKVGDMVVLMPAAPAKSASNVSPSASSSRDGFSDLVERDAAESSEQRRGSVVQDFSIVPSMIPRQSASQMRVQAQPSSQEAEENASEAIIPGLPAFRKK